MFLIRGLIVVSVTVLVSFFSILNRQTVDVLLNPIDLDVTYSLPVYAVFLAALAIGFLFGSLLVWMNMGGLRQDRRRQKRDIKLLEKEVGRLKGQTFDNNPTESSTVLAVLPSK